MMFRVNESTMIPGPVPAGISTTVGKKGRGVDRTRITREKQRTAIHQTVKNHELVRLILTDGHMTRPTSLEIGGRHSVQEGLLAAIEVEVFKKYRGSLLSGDPVKKLKRSNSRFHFIGSQDRLGDLVVESRCRFFSRNRRRE